MKSILIKIIVLFKLELFNVMEVVFYRFLVGSGFYRRIMPIGECYSGNFFKGLTKNMREGYPSLSEKFFISRAEEQLDGKISFFSSSPLPSGSPPDWFLNPFTGEVIKRSDQHWSNLREFSTGAGDIKCIWEVSRFSWAVVFAKAYNFSGDRRYLDALNEWVEDWTLKNPTNAGPNWKCGQEASIRVMNLLLASFLLGEDETPTGNMSRFIREHCERIEKTLYYAMAQNNNHGISEAGALFVGGAWLARHAGNNKSLSKKFLKWQEKGRCCLENRVKKLILLDGSFSQYSVNYHRLVLDTLSLVVFWQERLGLRSFSDIFYKRVRGAVIWLFQMTDTLSGDAPNIGNNDGTLLLQLSPCDYRDFRPSVQLASVVFLKKKAFDAGLWDEALSDLGLSFAASQEFCKKESRDFSYGGYVILTSDSSWAAVRNPKYRFRPSHADALHFDLWYKGRNILRDVGTYSYNSENSEMYYFSGTMGHNTAEFDGVDQMPRLSRFLWGAWTKCRTIAPVTLEENAVSWSGTYKDHRGCRHIRKIFAKDNLWYVVDKCSGFGDKTVLRWHLEPGKWELSGRVLRAENVEMEIKTDIADVEILLVDGWVSGYYMEKNPAPVLEITTREPDREIVTEIRLLEV